MSRTFGTCVFSVEKVVYYQAAKIGLHCTLCLYAQNKFTLIKYYMCTYHHSYSLHNN